MGMSAGGTEAASPACGGAGQELTAGSPHLPGAVTPPCLPLSLLSPSGESVSARVHPLQAICPKAKFQCSSLTLPGGLPDHKGFVSNQTRQWAESQRKMCQGQMPF